jgi:branched-chain amino acid transport system permease protein
MSKRKFKSLPQSRVRSERPLALRRRPGRQYRLLERQAYINPRSLRREREFRDERTIWLALCFVVLALGPTLLGSRSTLDVFGTFAIYAAINLMWGLVLGTSGVYSLATLAIVGTGGFVGGFVTLEFGLPWFMLPLIGAVAGLAVGAGIALPAVRLDGMYYALLTLGVAELARNFFRQSETFGSQTNGLILVPSFVPQQLQISPQGAQIRYLATVLLLLGALALYRFVDGRRLGLLLRSTRESESFSAIIGIDLLRMRLYVFMISSAALGFIGGFYASYNRSISANVFDINLLLLLFAMIVIGGMSSAEGILIGTAIVVFIDKELSEFGPSRVIGIGLLMIVVTLFTKGGLYGIPHQYRRWRDRRKSERIASRSEREGDLTAEEAALESNKDLVAVASFKKDLRDELKGLISDELIAEHRLDPLGKHSPELLRVLNYFRTGPIAEKYAIHVVKPFQEYRVIALSGIRGMPPRDVGEDSFSSLDDAYHAVFMRRVQDLLDT